MFVPAGVKVDQNGHVAAGFCSEFAVSARGCSPAVPWERLPTSGNALIAAWVGLAGWFFAAAGGVALAGSRLALAGLNGKRRTFQAHRSRGKAPLGAQARRRRCKGPSQVR